MEGSPLAISGKINTARRWSFSCKWTEPEQYKPFLLCVNKSSGSHLAFLELDKRRILFYICGAANDWLWQGEEGRLNGCFSCPAQSFNPQAVFHCGAIAKRFS